MPTEPPTQSVSSLISPVDIQQLTQHAWASLLGDGLTVDDDGPMIPEFTATMTGCVHLGGEWKTSLVLKCPMELANYVAATMFGAAPESLTIEDQRDALGEMANVIAGNLKPLIPGTKTLSLPVVAHGTDYSFKVHGARMVYCCNFSWQDQWLEVSLLERDTRPSLWPPAVQ